MHIFTTSHNAWLLEGLRYALTDNGVSPEVCGVDSAGELFCNSGGHLPTDSVLLPVFPDNQPPVCLRSLTFLSEWICLQKGLFYSNTPCILWGYSPLLRLRPGADRLPVIPWQLSPDELRMHLKWAVDAAHRPGRQRRIPVSARLTPREAAVLQRTLEGASLEQIARHLGVSVKTVWTHRRRAMDTLGVRRLHDLIQLTPEVLCASPS